MSKIGIERQSKVVTRPIHIIDQYRLNATDIVAQRQSHRGCHINPKCIAVVPASDRVRGGERICGVEHEHVVASSTAEAIGTGAACDGVIAIIAEDGVVA